MTRYCVERENFDDFLEDGLMLLDPNPTCSDCVDSFRMLICQGQLRWISQAVRRLIR